MRGSAVISWLAWSLMGLAGAAAEPLPVPNAEFRDGQQQPAGWHLSGTGRWRDREILEVSADGHDSSYWWTDSVGLQPQGLYRFACRARRVGGSGTAITGPAFANRDQAGLTEQWQWLGHVFRVPDSGGAGRLRLGHWQATGAIEFDAVRLTPVSPVYRRVGELVLGEGESVRGHEYRFAGSFGHPGSNHHRVLDHANASFNSDRWVFGSGSYVIYRFGLPAAALLSATLEVDVNYHTGGACRLEVSRDGGGWQTVAVQPGVGTAWGEVPGGLLPSDQLLVRLSAAEGPANFQVNRLEFRGRLDRRLPEASGETLYADLERSGGQLALESLTIRQDPAAVGRALEAVVVNQSTSPQTISAGVDDGRPEVQQQVAGSGRGTFDLQLPGAAAAGEHPVRVTVRNEQGEELQARLVLRVPEFHRSDYGARLAGVEGPAAIWWCDATRKVPRQRPLPEATAAAVQLEAAGGDYEAAQVVLRPNRALTGLTAEPTDLMGPGGHRIAAADVQILRVYYHDVQHPSDATGVRDWWPDALPPLDQPLDLAAGENQPLWVLVHVPPGAAAGDYTGSLQLAADGFAAQVPLRLHVWGFTLPARNHLETAFGLSVGDIWQYHGVRSEEDKRRLLDLYFASFAAHRISPYDPTPLDPLRVRFDPQAQPPRAELDFTAFDRAMSEAVQRYGFTNFRLGVQGLGGGTFHERYPPQIGEFGADTPQYQAMFSSYVSQLEQHLRERDWLDMAYVYWFDEPEPNDYEFVADGMRRLKQLAPGLQRMLTEEPGDPRLAGLVDIWCPISNNYDHQQAQLRRAAGERIWWYVCTGPKAPYCTLFIDHPATELRVWHWQAWQRGIVGSLVWQTNYWTSSAAFPDQPQDPYQDPMGYVSGYSTPRGAKRFWGNGDGRFLYPPLAASVPGKSGPQPVIAPPVSSIRWEMLREGIEDYEYLYLLRQLLEEKRDAISAEQARAGEQLLEVPASITADLTHFSTTPEPIYEHRRRVAEAIERLLAPADPASRG